MPHAFLEQYAAASFAISVVVAIEFEEGFADERVEEARTSLASFAVLPIDLPVAARGARIRRFFRERGSALGDHDVLIAATALQYDEPLVTDNLTHFSLVPGLRLVAFKP